MVDGSAQKVHAWRSLFTFVAWTALLVVVVAALKGSHAKPIEAQVEPPLSFADWKSLALQLAQLAAENEAYEVISVIPEEDGVGSGHLIEGYDSHFVFSKPVRIELDGRPFIETRVVVLRREDYPEMHRQYEALKKLGKVDLDPVHLTARP